MIVISPPIRSWSLFTTNLGKTLLVRQEAQRFRRSGLSLYFDQASVGIQPVQMIRRNYQKPPLDPTVACLPWGISPVSVASSTSASQMAPSWLS